MEDNFRGHCSSWRYRSNSRWRQQKPSSKEAEGNDGSNSTEKNEEKTEFAQNETVVFEGVEFTVTNVEKTTGSQYDTSKEGYEYVIVTVKIENKSEEKISYNSLNWKMENSKGQETDTAFTIVDTDTALNSGDLNAGGMIEGTLTFEEPQGDTGLKLNYYDNALFDDNAEFKIKLGA